jgi:phage gp36-like protein
MAYILQADLTEQLSESQLIQLTDDDRLGIVNGDRVTRAITSAESEINGFLGSLYTVPLAAPIPDLVQKWAVTIAVYLLYRRRQRVPDDVRQAYEDAIARLKDVVAGRLTLGIETDPLPSTQGNQGEVFGPPRVFTRETLERY